MVLSDPPGQPPEAGESQMKLEGVLNDTEVGPKQLPMPKIDFKFIFNLLTLLIESRSTV